ncbi:hypothetical protein QQ020_20220 [Fulvivirgaceae bacterium BMA12]|uniref:Uncharacterized protein n=1 Tax=Agaribacillus aureus TaxID=3051825 RepID=A0ABT8L9I7_9BACT|nr:hypothetical protein [Fulvivirgaceae bacterium BMA12]
MIAGIVLIVIDCLPTPSKPFSALVLAKHIAVILPFIYIFIRYFEKRLSLKATQLHKISQPLYEVKDVLEQSKPLTQSGKPLKGYLPIKQGVSLVAKMVIFILILAMIFSPIDSILDPNGFHPFIN